MRWKWPVSVFIVALVYLLTGVVGFVYHFREISAPDGIGIGIELTEFLAFVAGVFLLLGRNWARWLAVASIAFHVVLSIWNSWSQVAVHAVMCALIAWALFRPQASQYFRRVSA